MNAHTPFDANQDWTNPYCQNSSNDPMVDALLGNAYHVVRTVYCNLGNLKLIYDFLNQYGMVLGVQSEAELKVLTTKAKYARIYGFSRAGDRQVTDYLYVEGDRTGIIPDDPEATGSWITVATSGSSGGGTSSGEGAYIPWVYSNGSATGGETTINVPDGTVGVPFIIINGDMQYVGRGFEFNVDSLSVTLAQPLEEGDEVVFLLTGVPAVPDNPNVNDWIQINWLYNNGAAVGGEQVIAIPYTFQSVPAVYKNGLRLYKGLTTESYTADPDNQRILLTEPLATNDRLIVQIGGEAQVLETSDHTLQEVARATNVKDSEVILSTDTTQLLNGKKVIYSVEEQRAYGLPTLPSNVYISSVSGGQLTYLPGNIVVDLVPVPDSANELKNSLSQENGAILIDKGKVVNFIKKTSFSAGGVLSNNREAVKYSDDYWYIWNGSYPKTIGSSTPDNDSNWKCVGLLNGYAVNDAQNFGFTGGMDDALPVLNAMIKSPFFNMFFPMGSEINIASDWSLRSNLDIDFHASTLNWKGVVFTSDDVDNGSEMAVINTPNFAGGTSGSLDNVHLKNISIKSNDYAIGINLRNTTKFSLENVYVEKAQRQGINVSNCHNGCLNQITLKDCSPLSDKGFTSSQLESWGDGLIVWYGSTNVSIDNIHVESGNNSRGGRCGIVVDGYSPAGKPDPRNISINNAYVYGYDRPMHTELCGVVTVTNSVFEYNSGSNTHNLLQCAVVTWNVLEPTTYINCTFKTDKRFMKNSGAKAKFIKCNVYKTSSSEPIFITGTESTGQVEFDSCLISHAGGAWGAWNASLIFNQCTLSSDAPGSVIDFGSAEGAPKELRISNSSLKNIGITALFAPAFTEIHLTNSSIPGDVNCGDHARLFVSDCNISGDVSCKSVMRYSGAKPKSLGFIQNGDQQYNGNWLGTGKPVAGRPDGSGGWVRGDMVLNLDAVESAPYQWYCVTPGSPGRWSVAGTLGAAD